MKHLLSRINTITPLTDIVKHVAETYALGEIVQQDFVNRGYEEVNVKLVTSQGIFIVKLFHKTNPLRNTEDYIDGLLRLRQANVPVPELLQHQGTYLYQFDDENSPLYLCVMKFFDGDALSEHPITGTDITSVAIYLARIHSLPFTVRKNYDPWGVTNLASEFEKKKQFLNTEELGQVQPIIGMMNNLDTRGWTKCIIHGDLMKEHVLKDRRGNYCILDLGCMDHNYASFDIAIFVAHFLTGIRDTAHYAQLYKKALISYQSVRKLTSGEVSAIPFLITAHWAAYLLATSRLIAEGDTSAQTKHWYRVAQSELNHSIERVV